MSDHIADTGKMVPPPDTLREAIRLMATYARRAGYAEAVVEALCEEINRLQEPPVTVKNRHIQQEWQELRATAAQEVARAAQAERLTDMLDAARERTMHRGAEE